MIGVGVGCWLGEAELERLGLGVVVVGDAVGVAG
jgi:hypothetical protein